MTRIGAQREPFSRGEKLLFGLLPLGILGFALSGVWLSRSETVPVVTFPVAAPLPDPNGFDVYVAASRTIIAANPAVDPIDDRKALLTTNPKLAAQNYSLARRLAWLGSNRAGFALFQTALKTSSRFPGSAGMGSFAPLRQLAREKVIEANTLILQNRWNEATTCCLDTMQMGDDIARGGPLLAKLVGTAIGAIARSPLLTDKLVPERLNATQAKSAARRLESLLGSRPTYEAALKQDKWTTLADFLNTAQKGNWRSLANNNNGSGEEMTWRDRLSIQFLSPGQVAKNISDRCDESVRNIRRPFREATLSAAPLDPISSVFVYQSDNRFSEGRELTQINVLMLRFALRAYRLANGRFPAKLDDLAPRYLKSIPRDYFASGAPLRYKLSGQNYVLWSVGPDKIDNGGTPYTWSNGMPVPAASGRFPALMEDSAGDYVAGKSR